MEDKKKLSNEEIKYEELTDEQANKATGGDADIHLCSKCLTYFSGTAYILRGREYCETCYKANKDSKTKRSPIVDRE